MTTDIEVLDRMKILLDERLKEIKLEKPNEEEDGDYQLVNPAIYTCWVPHKNCLHEYGYDIPGIIICTGDGEDSDSDVSLDIRLNIQTYDPGLTLEDALIPNAKGYTDILNLITKIRLILNENPFEIGIAVEKPIKWGIYDEQLYPYYAGYVMFKVKMNPLPISQSISKFL